MQRALSALKVLQAVEDGVNDRLAIVEIRDLAADDRLGFGDLRSLEALCLFHHAVVTGWMSTGITVHLCSGTLTSR